MTGADLSVCTEYGVSVDAVEIAEARFAAAQEEVRAVGRTRSELRAADSPHEEKRAELAAVTREIEETDGDVEPGLLERQAGLAAGVRGPLLDLVEREESALSERIVAYTAEQMLASNALCECMRRVQQRFRDRVLKHSYVIELYGLKHDRKLRRLAKDFELASRLQASLGGEYGDVTIPVFKLRLLAGVPDTLARSVSRNAVA